MTKDPALEDSDAIAEPIESASAGSDDAALRAELDTVNNQYLRLAADFDNFRKRQAQERESLLKYGAQATLDALLPVLDNLSLARKNLTEQSDPAMMVKSFELLSTQLLDALRNAGLTQIDALNAPFNPECHEAISMVNNPELPDHTIVEVYKPGYMIHDRVLRPAQVVVATGGPNEAAVQSGFDPSTVQGKDNPFVERETE